MPSRIQAKTAARWPPFSFPLGALLAGSRRRRRLLARLVGNVLAGLLVDRLHAEADLAAIVDTQDLDLYLVAFLDHVGDLGDAARRQLRDVDQAVAGAQEV